MKSKLALGSVQFGLNYGISNKTGVPDDESLIEILKVAKDSNITKIDTASAYGNAEKRIGQLARDFQIITKFSNVKSVDELNLSLGHSLQNLNAPNIYAYLAHHSNDIINNLDIWKGLIALKQDNKTQKIGYSLYEIEQLEILLSLNIIPDIVQLPYSIFDRKFEPFLPILKKHNTEIHIRSVFLQGLYFLDTKTLPNKLKPMATALNKLEDICSKYNLTKAQVAINYIAKNNAVDNIVIGVENAKQLAHNIALTNHSNILNEVYSEIEAIEITDKKLLNPSNWL